ncbi:DUF2750 domain-containing protein [Oceanisphaera pacifica]|uniref:DUF2750 domain-containing protein n=1 Tax=Oceanisphaera pacifica TaxID=2818389 RepID=A0ABS3ND70_9GAMM|nr:DUF2750 domain-containing protein [Oceanisphaera pacifica]MBO1518485.1 DUF2750 domain-containing protein [Oceanisphaera pacifica]
MSYSLTDTDQAAVEKMQDNERYNHFVNKVVEHQEMWILTDEHGCMMLTTEEDEDCIPMWPHADYAKTWAVEDWAECQPEAISMKTWQSRWLPGMEEDELLVAVFPVTDAAGALVEPGELQDAFKRKQSGR